MIRIFFTAVWLCAVTMAGVYGGTLMAKNRQPAEELAVAPRSPKNYVETDLTAVPVISGNDIEGYFLTRMAFILDETKNIRTDIPIELLLNDYYLGYAYNNENIDFRHSERFDLNKFSDGLVQYINRKLGVDIVVYNLILQVDYRRVKDIRSSSTDRI